jgi:CheY-like chemotaxis protein
MLAGGSLRIGISPVNIDVSFASKHLDLVAGPYVRLEVEDTGEGMDEEIQARIFEPFFTTKPAGKGTGLGLSTVFGIVRQLNGGIDVTSAVGAGTTFRVWLPLATDHPALLHAPPEGQWPIVGTEGVLVVDDDAAVCQLAGRVLGRAGFSVWHAVNPREALLIAERHGAAIELLVTDVVMPQITGLELGRQVSALIKGLKILYISGYSDDVLRQSDLMPGESRLIRKPFSSDALVRSVRELLDTAAPGGR